MNGINSLFLIANIGTKPVLKTSQGGTTYSRFLVVQDEKRGEAAKALWFTVVAFGKLAKTLEILGAGDQVAIVGKLIGHWKGADAHKHLEAEIEASEIQFLRLRAWKTQTPDSDTPELEEPKPAEADSPEAAASSASPPTEPRKLELKKT